MALSRRHFLGTLPAAAFAETRPLKISAVEMWELRGHRRTERGIDQLRDREGCERARDLYLARYPNGTHVLSVQRRCRWP